MHTWEWAVPGEARFLSMQAEHQCQCKIGPLEEARRATCVHVRKTRGRLVFRVHTWEWAVPGEAQFPPMQAEHQGQCEIGPLEEARRATWS